MASPRVQEGPEALELLRIAEMAGDAPETVVAAATAAAAWIWFGKGDACAGLDIVHRALVHIDHSAVPPTFTLLQIGIECAESIGNDLIQDKFIERIMHLTNDADQAAQARFLRRRGDHLLRKGKVTEAEKYYRTLSNLFANIGDVRSQAATLGKIADVIFTRGDLDEALRIHREEALPVHESQGEVLSRAVTLGKIADILFARGDLDESLRIRLEEQLPIYDFTRNQMIKKKARDPVCVSDSH